MLRTDGVELIIMIVATFAQALAGHSTGVHIIGALIVWRFIMGVGIGGDYPLSAVISSEFASTHIRGRLMTAVFAFQGWGNFRKSPMAHIRRRDPDASASRLSCWTHRRDGVQECPLER
jgi:PHS family inorganic phosphate transporter-like MFS transporter